MPTALVTALAIAAIPIPGDNGATRAGATFDHRQRRPDERARVQALVPLDYRTGKTMFKVRAGLGIGYNSNYAPVTLGPDATAYVGTLGGLVALRDAQ
jgi:hypothetical protein